MSGDIALVELQRTISVDIRYVMGIDKRPAPWPDRRDRLREAPKPMPAADEAALDVEEGR